MVGGVRGLKQHAFHPGNGYCGAVCPEVEYSPLTQSLGIRTWLIPVTAQPSRTRMARTPSTTFNPTVFLAKVGSGKPFSI